MSNEGIFNNGIHMPVQLQKVNEPVNWQHYRIQAAIAAMQGIISNTGRCAAVCEIAREDGMTPKQTLIATSVELADALIAELQKKQD